jgi:hypothetical protein
MNPLEYISDLVAWLTVIICLLFVIAKKIDAMYENKDKPRNTVIHCPVSDSLLKDYEVFSGHCFKCPVEKRERCQAHITAQTKTLIK